MPDRPESRGREPTPGPSTAVPPPESRQVGKVRGDAAKGDGRRHRRSVFSTLGVAQLLIGAALAAFGLLTVLDYLSLRMLLDETGPRRLSKVVVDLHTVLAHPGAQVVELVLALLGLTIAARSLRGLLWTAR